MELKIKGGGRVFLLTTVLVGAGGVLGQLTLLRELLVIFYGNELILGIILGNWVVLEAAGAYLAGRLPLRFCQACYLAGLLLYGFLLTAALFFTRGIHYSLFGLLPGEALGFIHLFAISLVILAPASFVHGTLFTLASRLLRNASNDDNTSAGRIYLFETLGSLVAGILFSLFLAPLFDSIQISLALLILHLAAAGLVLVYFEEGRKLQAVFLALVVIVAASLTWFYYPVSKTLHGASLSRQWPGLELVHYENSPYGNLVVTVSGGEYTVFYDGRPSITAPNPDRAALEDLIFLAAGAHPAPTRVLMVGGGAGGAIEALLRHPVDSIDYVELDPRLPALLLELPLHSIHAELADPRVKTVTRDARLYLQEVDYTYDLVILGFLQPDSLQENRLFTRQFFELVRKKTAPGGILVFSAPGSPLRLTPEILPLLASLYQTAAEVFPYVEVLPGESTLYFASESPLFGDYSVIIERLEERSLGDGIVTDTYLENRFDELRITPIKAGITGYAAVINEDFRPAGFYYSMYYWGGLYSPAVFSVLRKLENLPLVALAGGFLLLVLLASGRLGLRREKTAILPFAVFSSGVAGMAFNLLVLFIFQTLYGYVYQMIGILVALFMAGAAIGGAWGVKMAARDKAGQKLARVELFTVLLHPALYILALFLQFNLDKFQAISLISLLSLYAVLGGIAIGAHFPLSVSLAGKAAAQQEPAGTLYAADLIGGWVGGLLVSILLFPLLGLAYTLALLGLFKTTSFFAVCRAYLRSG